MKSLKEYTQIELYKVLDNNESHDALTLAGICSEILRRQKRCDISKIRSCLDELCNLGRCEYMERIENLKYEIESELGKL